MEYEGQAAGKEARSSRRSGEPQHSPVKSVRRKQMGRFHAELHPSNKHKCENERPATFGNKVLQIAVCKKDLRSNRSRYLGLHTRQGWYVLSGKSEPLTPRCSRVSLLFSRQSWLPRDTTAKEVVLLIADADAKYVLVVQLRLCSVLVGAYKLAKWCDEALSSQ